MSPEKWTPIMALEPKWIRSVEGGDKALEHTLPYVRPTESEVIRSRFRPKRENQE